ncbi:MAG TPA: hypothetical protein VK530_08460 [Candidatus Acidoferrum sp.]|nr:hypothetical protein [Candidatus Acidoferrum sp.]
MFPTRHRLIVAVLFASTWFGCAQTPVRIATFTNRFNAMDEFGASITGVGGSAVAVGAPKDNNLNNRGGAVYIFSTSGALMTYITNPAPVPSSEFGQAVAALGNDRVIVGSYRTTSSLVGRAHLFSTNGTRLLTLTNPNPVTSDWFGYSVAGVGADKIFVGAPLHFFNGSPGAAYLFDTNGVLLRTFTSSVSSGFGWAVAGLGSDRLLVRVLNDASPPARAAFLYHINGTLLATFNTNGSSSSASSSSRMTVAAVGTDKLLIGNPAENIAIDGVFVSSGAAYLYDTNGNLLSRFLSPWPQTASQFGRSISAVGTNKVLIGAFANGSGLAFTFALDGTWLSTFAVPSDNDAIDDNFGYAVTSVGENRVAIGAKNRSGNYPNSGEAYLFTAGADAPVLTIAPSAPPYFCAPDVRCIDVKIMWPAPATGFVLERTSAFTGALGTGTWVPVSEPYNRTATGVWVNITPAQGTSFYRLRIP